MNHRRSKERKVRKRNGRAIPVPHTYARGRSWGRRDRKPGDSSREDSHTSQAHPLDMDPPHQDQEDGSGQSPDPSLRWTRHVESFVGCRVHRLKAVPRATRARRRSHSPKGKEAHAGESEKLKGRVKSFGVGRSAEADEGELPVPVRSAQTLPS